MEVEVLLSETGVPGVTFVELAGSLMLIGGAVSHPVRRMVVRSKAAINEYIFLYIAALSSLARQKKVHYVALFCSNGNVVFSGNKGEYDTVTFFII